MVELISKHMELLKDCSPETVFWTMTGKILHNLYELVDYLKHCSDEDFQYHVNQEKNDFAVWIRDVFEDGILAARLAEITERTRYADVIEERLKDCEADKCA